MGSQDIQPDSTDTGIADTGVSGSKGNSPEPSGSKGKGRADTPEPSASKGKRRADSPELSEREQRIRRVHSLFIKN
jgi:hypothetical protein